nr:ribonuclease H-like domain-containing protein [Tanacetum cinerariifolium]
MMIPLLVHFATVSAKEFHYWIAELPLLKTLHCWMKISFAHSQRCVFVIFRIIQQYLQNKYYALWEVIEFGDSYKAPPEEIGKGPASECSAKKKGRTVVITTEDMQKRRNDVKARTTLLLALPDEHQLRFSKYETAKELWEAILKIFGENEASKKTKKNQLKQQYGNFKAESLKTLEQTFNRLQAIRNRDDLDTMSLDDVYNHLKVYESEVQKKSESNSQNMAFISSSNTSSGKGEVHTASVPTASIQVSTASTNVAAASLSHDTVCLERDVIRYNKIEYLKNELKQGNLQNNIDDKGYWDSGCSWHMTGNTSYLSEYEPYDGGYVSFGHRGGKIIGKGIIKTVIMSIGMLDP